MAVLLTVCKMRHGGSWDPWFREGTFEDEGSLADEIREWPEYQEGLSIVRLFLKKHDAREKEHGRNVTDTIEPQASEGAGLQG